MARAKASTWPTPDGRLLRPWQDLVREKLHSDGALDESTRALAWYHLTNSYNSDGQWPHAARRPAHRAPYNYAYCFDNLLRAELLVGGVDRSRLTADRSKPSASPLHAASADPQEGRQAAGQGSDAEKAAAAKAATLILKSQNVEALRVPGSGCSTPPNMPRGPTRWSRRGGWSAVC